MKSVRIVLKDGIIRQGKLEFKVDKLTLDQKGRILKVEGKELCPECDGYIIYQSSCANCLECGYSKCQ